MRFLASLARCSPGRSPALERPL